MLLSLFSCRHANSQTMPIIEVRLSTSAMVSCAVPLLDLKEKDVVLPFATDPKILKCTVGFSPQIFFYRFLEKKNVFKHIQYWEISAQRGSKKKVVQKKKKRFPTDRPMFWHLKAIQHLFFLGPIVTRRFCAMFSLSGNAVWFPLSVCF